ncbi:MAG: PilN domain-containing protein [Anaerolineales bacterium]
MIRINLLPRAPRRRIAGLPLLEIGLPLLAFLVVLFWWVALNNQINGIERQIVATDQQITELQPQVARVQELKRLIDEAKRKEELLDQLLATQLPASAILANIRVLIPKDVWLSTLGVPDARSFTLDGFALSYVAVARLMDNLESARIFEGLDLTTAERERIGDREVVKYQVTGRLVRPSASPEGQP